MSEAQQTAAAPAAPVAAPVAPVAAPVAPVAAPKADPTKLQLAKEFAYHRPLFGCRVDPLGRYIVSGAQSNTVQRWTIADGKLAELAGHDSWVRALAFSADGQTLLSGGYDGRLMWWPIGHEQPVPVRSVDAHAGWIRSVSISPDGTQIATTGNDNLVKLWDFAAGRPLQTFSGHARHTYQAVFHPQGGRLVSCDLLGVIKDWDLATGKEVRQLDGKVLHSFDNVFLADMGGARGLTFTPDGKQFAVAGITEVSNAFAGIGEPLIVLFDWEKGEVVQKFKAKEKFQGVAWGVEWHPDAYFIGLLSGGTGGAICFFKPDAANEFHRFNLPNRAFDLSLATDRYHLAIAHLDRKLRLYRLGPAA